MRTAAFHQSLYSSTMYHTYARSWNNVWLPVPGRSTNTAQCRESCYYMLCDGSVFAAWLKVAGMVAAIQETLTLVFCVLAVSNSLLPEINDFWREECEVWSRDLVEMMRILRTMRMKCVIQIYALYSWLNISIYCSYPYDHTLLR
jgi:hypothetical protein